MGLIGRPCGPVLVARAPVRVADVGGWTDTWFGSPGRVCHLAVGPGVEVRAALVDRATAPDESGMEEDEETIFAGSTTGPEPAAPQRSVGSAGAGACPVRLRLPDLGEDYRCVVSAVGGGSSLPGRHPLVEHAVVAAIEWAVEFGGADVRVGPQRAADQQAVAKGHMEIGRPAVPEGAEIEVLVTSAVPVGASLGTSAAVVVAVLAALDELLAGLQGSRGGGRRSPAELAVAAHEVETQRSGREAGVQDQWAAALGGAGLMTVGPYPTVRHQAIAIAPAIETELADRLVTVAFGPHDSSVVHDEVIDAVVGCGGAAHDQARRSLGRLAALADEAATALEAGDVDAWAETLTEATETQRALHPALVGPAHQAAIDLALGAGASGWKVNGAGGAGGSLTVVAQDADAAAALTTDLSAVDPTWLVLDLTPSPGLIVARR